MAENKSSFKFVLFAIGLGVVTALALVSIYIPKMILWYFDPPTSIGISCTPSIEWAIHKMRTFQLYSVLAGAIFGLLLGVKFRPKNNSTKQVEPK